MATTHYPIGGSSVKLAELCPGSVKARKTDHAPAGPQAQKGTRIHTYVELIWKQAHSDHKPTKEERDFIKFLDEKERQAGASLVEALRLLCTKYGFNASEVHIEKQFAFIEPVAGGTPDAFMFKAFGDIIMIDFKTGHHQVFPEGNLQLLFYLCAILRNLDPFLRSQFDQAHLIILQTDADSPLIVHTRTWSIAASELAQYDGRFAAVVARAEANPDLRTPGNHCEEEWCSVRSTCQERLSWVDDRSLGQFAKLREGEAGEVGARGERLAMFLEVIPTIREWCNSVEADAKDLAIRVPGAVPRHTIADTISKREWAVSEKEIEKTAKELGLEINDYKPRALIGPKPFETLCKVKKIQVTDPSDPEKTVPFDVNPLTQRRITGSKLVKGEAVTVDEKFMQAITG